MVHIYQLCIPFSKYAPKKIEYIKHEGWCYKKALSMFWRWMGEDSSWFLKKKTHGIRISRTTIHNYVKRISALATKQNFRNEILAQVDEINIFFVDKERLKGFHNPKCQYDIKETSSRCTKQSKLGLTQDAEIYNLFNIMFYYALKLIWKYLKLSWKHCITWSYRLSISSITKS